MTATTTKYLNPDGDVDLFDVDWKTLNTWLTTSQIPDGVSRFDILRELENRRGVMKKNTSSNIERNDYTGLVNEWVTYLDDDELELVLTTSSLTEGSDFSFGSQHDIGDDEIKSSSRPSDEEKDDNSYGIIKRENFRIESHENDTKETHENSKTTIKPSRKAIAEATTGASKGNVSYAQLFFDPETKMLVTLMEMMNNVEPGGHPSDKGHQRYARQKNHRKGTPLHRSSLLNNNSSVATRDSRKSSDTDEPQDRTLLTECSSVSSEMSHNDGDWGFHAVKFEHTSSVTKKTRYSDEPIVFSNDDSMDQLCWLDEAEISLFLLHDCDDNTWDYGTAKGARCTDTLKKLLKSSRLCISLPQIGESKWKASNNSSNNDLSKGNDYKVQSERISYSVLNEL